VHPRIGMHNREGDVLMLASYEAIHRDGIVFLVYIYQKALAFDGKMLTLHARLLSHDAGQTFI
jgi:hypothetical protein